MTSTAIVCLESREADQLGLALLFLSLREFHSDIPVFVYTPSPPAYLEQLCKADTNCNLRKCIPESALGWNCKPQVMLRLLEEGFDRVIWFDSDVVINGTVCKFWDGDLESIVLATEARSGPQPNGAHLRCETWGIHAVRQFADTLNTCVVSISSRHKRLVEHWQHLILSPAYIATQQLPLSNRPTFALGDQDALNALLCSEQWREVPVRQLKIGRDLIHTGHPLAFPLGLRLAWLFSRPAVFHAGAARPWSWYDYKRAGMLRSISHALSLDCSHYRIRANQLDLSPLPREAVSCLKATNWLGAMLAKASLGLPALTGLPLTAAAQLVKAVSRTRPRRVIDGSMA